MEEPCEKCQGTGKIKHECRTYQLKTIKDHPCNVTDYMDATGSQGYTVQQCVVCQRVFGTRWQFDAGTGSDCHEKDYGIGDPFVLVKERHY
jgi:hypothetical protein